MKIKENRFLGFEATFKNHHLIERMSEAGGICICRGCSSWGNHELIHELTVYERTKDDCFGKKLERYTSHDEKEAEAKELEICKAHLPEGMTINDFLTLNEKEQKVLDLVKEIFKDGKFDKDLFVKSWTDKSIKFKSTLARRFDIDNRELITALVSGLSDNAKIKEDKYGYDELDYAHYFTYDELTKLLPAADMKYLINHKFVQLGNTEIIDALKKNKYDIHKALIKNKFTEDELLEIIELDKFNSTKFISICTNAVTNEFEYVVEQAQNVKELMLHQTENISDDVLQTVIENLTRTPMPDGTKGTLLNELQRLLTDSNIRNLSKKLKNKPSSALYLYLMGLQADRETWDDDGNRIQHSAKFIPQTDN